MKTEYCTGLAGGMNEFWPLGSFLQFPCLLFRSSSFLKTKTTLTVYIHNVRGGLKLKKQPNPAQTIVNADITWKTFGRS